MSVIIRLQREPSLTDQGGGKRRASIAVGLAVAARRLAKLIWIKQLAKRRWDVG
jgi:hypothetical protein